MNDADKMRVAFEAWAKHLEFELSINKHTNSYFGSVYDMWEAWQAATAQQNERIKDLEAQIEHQRAMLTSRSY